MDFSGLGLGERIAAGSALVLLLSMFAFGWFSLDGISAEGGALGGSIELGPDELDTLAEESGGDRSASAWQAFSLIDIVLLIAAVAAIGVVAMRASGNEVPSGAGMVVAGLGALGLLLVLFRLVSPPDLVAAFGGAGTIPDELEFDTEVGRGLGAFVGLIAVAGLAYGGFLMSGQESSVAPSSSGPQAPPPPPTT